MSSKAMVRRPGRAFWRGRVFLLVLSVVGSLALCEVTLRLVGFEIAPPTHVGEHESRPSKNFVPDPETGWSMRPEHRFRWRSPEGEQVSYCSDARGRRTGCEEEEASSAARLVVAGDSFTWGTDVEFEETYGALLGQAHGWEVHNVAMPGFGLDQVWQSVRRAIDEERPALVLVGIFDNDFERSRFAHRREEGFEKPRFELRGGELVRRTPADNPGSLVRSLESELRTWMLARALLRHAGRRLPIGEWWTLNAAILDQIQADCAAAGVPLFFVRIPSERWRSFPVLDGYMRRSGARYLDLARPDPSPPAGSLHFDEGGLGHLTRNGHRYLYEQLSPWIDGHLPELVR